MTTKPNDFDDYDRELEAAANTPERIAEDAVTVARRRLRTAIRTHRQLDAAMAAAPEKAK